MLQNLVLCCCARGPLIWYRYFLRAITQNFPLSLSLALSLYISPTFSFFLSLSISFSHSFPLSLPLFIFLSLSFSLSYSISHYFFLSLPLSYSLSLSPSVSSISLSLSRHVLCYLAILRHELGILGMDSLFMSLWVACLLTMNNWCWIFFEVKMFRKKWPTNAIQ